MTGVPGLSPVESVVPSGGAEPVNLTQVGGTALNAKTSAGYLPSSSPTQVRINQTPTVSASPAYSAGDCVGGLMTFAAASYGTDLSAWITKIVVNCKSAQTAPIDMVFYNANPSATTFTDNSAMALNAADFNKVNGVIHLIDWTNLGTPSQLQAFPNLPFLPTAGATTLYANLVARAGFTLGSTSDLDVFLHTQSD